MLAFAQIYLPRRLKRLIRVTIFIYLISLAMLIGRKIVERVNEEFIVLNV